MCKFVTMYIMFLRHTFLLPLLMISTTCLDFTSQETNDLREKLVFGRTTMVSNAALRQDGTLKLERVLKSRPERVER